MLKMEEGITPLWWLFERSKTWSTLSMPKVRGIWPSSSLYWRDKWFSLDKYPISFGIWPWKVLFPMSKNMRNERFPICLAMVPPRPMLMSLREVTRRCLVPQVTPCQLQNDASCVQLRSKALFGSGVIWFLVAKRADPSLERLLLLANVKLFATSIINSSSIIVCENPIA